MCRMTWICSFCACSNALSRFTRPSWFMRRHMQPAKYTGQIKHPKLYRGIYTPHNNYRLPLSPLNLWNGAPFAKVHVYVFVCRDEIVYTPANSETSDPTVWACRNMYALVSIYGLRPFFLVQIPEESMISYYGMLLVHGNMFLGSGWEILRS